MKKILLIFLFVITAASCNAQTPQGLSEKNGIIDTAKVLEPDSIHPKVNQIITRILENYHYSRPYLNDSVSSVIFDNYISSLDYNRMYFYQSDIEKFEKYRLTFDDDLVAGNLTHAFEIFNTYKQRMNERMDYIFARLEHEFNYEMDEEYSPDRTEANWAPTEVRINNLWRKRLKNESINLILNNSTWEKASDVLVKRYKNLHKVILQYKPEDVFQLYLNSFADAIDPHTSYFSPRTSENFRINMSLSLEGIGASLTSENDFTKIARIIAGGPADKSKKLFEDDRILGVAQGEEGEMVDVVGWRLDDVVSLIRGEKGSKVRLKVLKDGDTPDMPTEEIVIVRDKVKLEEQAAKKKVFTIKDGESNFKLGVIELPAFYSDFEAKARGETNYKSTTKDVKQLLYELKKEKVDGLIIDLRNNGGGSLQEAIELTGLFIEDGPVVQVRNSTGSVEVGEDPDPAIIFDAPLAVMVNRNSASASEIFAGALQDYGRGIVIGERTFGKGTVQNLIDLNRFIPIKDSKLGQLKLTIAKYYRVTGSSTQRMGIIPDVIYPSHVEAKEFGESSRPSALSWDRINSAQFKAFNDLSNLVPKMLRSHAVRIRKNPEFHYLIDEIEEYKENRKKKSFSLNIEKRKKEKKKTEERRKKREEMRERMQEFKITNKQEINVLESKLDDPLLEEGARILADLIQLSDS